MGGLSDLHEEILRILRQRGSSYSAPVSSFELGSALHVTPSYIREQATKLQARKLIGVRRGRGGGYYIRWLPVEEGKRLAASNAPPGVS